MAKQLNVSLAFSADTSQAKMQIQGLVNELNKLSSISTKSVGTEKLTSEIIEAKMAAKDLGAMLEQSFNVDTGKLDLNKFNSSLKKSGMSLTDYGNKIAMLGNQGDQAFLKIAQSIIETEAPLRRSSGLLKEFGTTLANTARWQISSSILHGFMGSVQKAYGYAQDLNESLNNIRIVTGQNTDQMARFAKQANQAAKVLSTTTTDYTNASLIYYQQGLNDQEVQQRTDITVKMANVAGQSAETVSDQLTAVWNNFDDGTKSLEHYADVMTALGAATASSTDEIADGLEKFAAVADTVGLSYEYAASALATVTATTRQSADVVGTAFKTLFARIEGLELGETLDDGTTLNKYSEALKVVGVNIKDSHGEMKEMDTILDEMAAKWDTLNKDQQIALAQTVAGVRQYTQLVALMDNWDFMKENLATSANSAGTLDEQQKIYEESWAASQDRVKASMEGVFKSLINEDFFIELNDALSSVLEVVEKLVKAFGGMPGVLSLVGVLITSIFKDEMAGGINNALHNFKNFTGASKEELKRLKKEAYEYARSMTEGLANTPGSEAIDAQRKHLERTYEMQKQLEVAIAGTNSAQEKAIRGAYEIAENYSKAAFEAAKFAKEAEEAANKSRKNFSDKQGANFVNNVSSVINDANEGATGRDLINSASWVSKQASSLGDAEVDAQVKILDNLIEKYEAGEIESGKLITAMSNVEKVVYEATEPMRVFETEVLNSADSVSDFQTKIETLQSETKHFDILDNSDESKQTFQEFENKLLEIKNKLKELNIDSTSYDDAISKLEKLKAVSDPIDKKKDWDEFVKTLESLGLKAEEAEQKVQELAEKATIDKVGGKKTVRRKKGESEEDYETRKKERRGKRSGVKSELKRKEKETKELTKQVYKGTQAQEGAAAADDLAAKKKEALVKAMEKAKKSTQDFGQGVTKMMNGVSSLSMGLTSLSSAWDALQDPDMSAWDKFTSIMMSMSMSIPSLISGFKGLGSGIKEMTGALGGSTMALLANALGLDAEALAQDEANDEKIEGMILDKESQKIKTELLLNAIKSVATSTLEKEAQEELNEEKGKESVLTLGNIAMKKMEQMASAGGTASKIAETGATIGATLAQHEFNAALAPFIGLMLAAVAAILPYIAAAAALAAVVGLVVYATTAEARALETARDNVISATEAYERATEEANKFKEAVSNYDSAVEALQELKKGTNEYAEQVKKANEEAKKLIETYGLWDYVKKDGDLIIFKPNTLEDIQEQKDSAATQAEIDKYLAEIILRNKEKNKESKNPLPEIKGKFVTGRKATTVVQGETIEVGDDTSLNYLDMQVISDFLSQINLENLDSKGLETEINNIIAASEEVPAIIANNVKAIAENIDVFKQLTPTISKFNSEIRYKLGEVFKPKIEELYGDKIKAAAENNEENYSIISDTIVNTLAKAEMEYNPGEQSILSQLGVINVDSVNTNNALEDVIKNTTGKTIDLNDEELAREYARTILGFDPNEVNKMVYKEGTGIGTLTDASGKITYVNEVNDIEMRQAVAQKYKQQAVYDQYNLSESKINGVSVDQYVASIQEIAEAGNQLGEEFGGNFTAALMNSINNGSTMIDFSSLFGNLDQAEFDSLSKMSTEELLTKLGLDEATLQAAGYKDATAFTTAFQQGLASWTPELSRENFQSQVNSLLTEDISKYELDASVAKDVAEGFIEMAEAGKEGYEILREDAEAAKDATTRYIRLNNAVLDISDNYDDYADVLKAVRTAETKQDKALAASSEAGKKLKKSLSDLLGTTEDFIDSDLLGAIDPKDFDAASKGDVAAIGRIRDEFIKLQAEANNIGFSGLKEELDKLQEGVVIDINGNEMPLLHKLLQAKVDAGATAADIESLLSGFNIDADVTDFVGTMEEMTSASESASAQVIENTSFSQDVSTTTADNITTHEEAGFDTSYTSSGNQTFSATVLQEDADGNLITVTETYPIVNKTVTPTVETEQTTDEVSGTEVVTGNAAGKKGQVKGVKIENAHKSTGGTVSPGTRNSATNKRNGGGGGSKPKKTSESRKKKSDVVDRYKEINDKLEETTRLMDKNSIAAEGLWGPKRIAKLKENIKLMEKENKQLKEKYQLTLKYLNEDKNALLNAGKDAGINFNIDSETDLITNYTDVMTQLFNEREALLNSFGETMDEAEEERLAEFDKKVDAIKESYEQYETTLDEKKDAEEEHLQKILDIQTAYYDLLNEELEVNLSVNEKDLEILEYYLNKFSDDFYHMAEAATLMVGDFANGKMGGQMAEYFSNIDMYQNNMKQMEKDHSTINPETGATYINDEQYVKALGDTMSNVLGELSNIINIDKQMLEYYADALAAAGEEVTKYTDRIEHLNGVLDHYRNVMSLMGKEKDYKKMGTIIAGQVKVAEDQMNAAKATYDMYVEQQKDIYDKWQKAIASGDTAAAELFEKEYYAITETVEEAQNNFLSSTEATLEAYKAQLENGLAEIGEILEKSLTGGKGFDWINSTMERMNSLHEEYLTTTNKIYETNKMMNQTQQEIDKTSNTVAKRKLKDFINQTKSLQEQTALSKFELDIQKAKYDLLLAEIALEEAQNAKSQVRLQRDSEGNFGYVYTADTSAVDDAQQKYEDAQNNLYNISLEGANKYVEQRNQLTQEFYDTMRELEQQWLDGSFTSEEEYRAAQEEAQTYYYERLRQASELYNVAIGADASAAAEHILGQENLVYNESFTNSAGIARKWKSVNEEMMRDSSIWQEQVSKYVGGVINSFNLWNQRCGEIEEETHLDNLAGEVENITKKSGELVDELTKEGGVIDSVEEQLDKVQKVTEAYALQRKEIQGLIKDLEKYIKTLQDKYKAETQPEEEPEEEKPEDNPTKNNNSDTGAAATALAQEARELVTAVHTGTIKNGANGWIPSARSAGYSEKAISIALKAINESKTGAGYGYYYDKALALIDSYDTGGYTGEWNGSYGKLAMVHQKELILNENDTANFLAGMEIFRQIISTIDLQSANMAYLGNVNSPTLGALQDGTLEQNVHIEASFPNVTDSNQIEEAFKDIVNLASQYANRK